MTNGDRVRFTLLRQSWTTVYHYAVSGEPVVDVLGCSALAVRHAEVQFELCTLSQVLVRGVWLRNGRPGNAVIRAAGPMPDWLTSAIGAIQPRRPESHGSPPLGDGS